jgi:hypothetical protein
MLLYIWSSYAPAPKIDLSNILAALLIECGFLIPILIPFCFETEKMRKIQKTKTALNQRFSSHKNYIYLNSTSQGSLCIEIGFLLVVNMKITPKRGGR